MDRLIWTAVSGMSASMARQRMIASNMANAQTIGFRAEVMQFTPMTLKGPSLEARALSDGAVRGALMNAGVMIQTGRALDVAVEGDTCAALLAADASRDARVVSSTDLETWTELAAGTLPAPPTAVGLVAGRCYLGLEDGTVLRMEKTK